MEVFFSYLFQVRACLEEVPGSMAFLVADAAARRSAKNYLIWCWSNLKLFGAWCGTEVRMNFVSLKSDKWKYLEEASETSFCFPGNH
jgi:hypothetical protein